jgi:hypothetical protein
MWLFRQWFGADVVARIAATVKAEPSLSRRALSRQVCEWLGWRAPGGQLREVSCRKALLALQRRGCVELPACAKVAGFGAKRATRSARPAVAAVQGRLEELGAVTVVPVTSRYSAASRRWNALMQAYHYLGAGPLCGAQMRYLVHSATYGWLGALSFSAAAWRLKSRDTWIGWSERARRANLAQVVCNSRFLIVPSVQVANLASHVLALSLRRLAGDWRARYGYEPVLVETFVDGQRFAGTCYRAANWVGVGQTAGRPDGYSNGTRSTGRKEIYMYPLRPDWQSILGQEPPDPLGLRPARPGAEWAEEEFAGARLYDERLRRRLYRLAQDFFAQPGVRIPQACSGSAAQSKAAYRFLDNARVDMRSLLTGHVEATAQRMRPHAVVLAVQDTTTLNYTAHPATEDLGPINTQKDQGVGLLLHDTLAFTVEGTPLGVVDAQCWARDPQTAGKKAQRNQLPIEAKESVKWLRSYRATAAVQQLCPTTLVVSVGDREADLHELFSEAQQTPGGPQLLVRAERTRRRLVEAAPGAEHEYLWAKMAAAPVAGEQTLAIPRQGARPARTATLEVRYAAVTLRPPARHKALAAVAAWAVYAREVAAPPEVSAPLEWMLLTTVPVTTFAQATERLQWYTRRWGIEVYHRVLKSGCRIEDRQLGSAGSLQSCLAIDLVVAWRIFWLVKQGRETPNVPCDIVLEDDEWKALYATVRNAPPPATPPPLREAVRMIAALGGFLGRRHDGEPGTITVWRGLERLDNIVLGYRVAQRLAAAARAP